MHPYQRCPKDTLIFLCEHLCRNFIEPCNAAPAVVVPPGGGDADQLCSFDGAHAGSQTLPTSLTEFDQSSYMQQHKYYFIPCSQ